MNTVLSYGFGFAALLVARFAFDAPIWFAALLGVAASYVLPRAFLLLGMKVSRSLIERSPEGRTLTAEHDAEQAAAWKEWENIKQRRAQGKPVDEKEADRVEGILFRNEGVAGNRKAYSRPPPSRGTAPPIKISTDSGKRGPQWMLSNVGPELALYFRPRPADPVWKLITEENAPAYQLCFQQMLLRAGLMKLYSSNQIDD
jgi:hypothetical protein